MPDRRSSPPNGVPVIEVATLSVKRFAWTPESFQTANPTPLSVALFPVKTLSWPAPKITKPTLLRRTSLPMRRLPDARSKKAGTAQFPAGPAPQVSRRRPFGSQPDQPWSGAVSTSATMSPCADFGAVKTTRCPPSAESWTKHGHRSLRGGLASRRNAPSPTLREHTDQRARKSRRAGRGLSSLRAK